MPRRQASGQSINSNACLRVNFASAVRFVNENSETRELKGSSMIDDLTSRNFGQFLPHTPPFVAKPFIHLLLRLVLSFEPELFTLYEGPFARLSDLD